MPEARTKTLSLAAALFCFVVLGLGWRACGPVLVSLPDYRGVTIDAINEKPVPGVHVIAVWYAQPLLSVHGGEYVTHSAEAVSDAQGRFVIRAPRLFVRPPWVVYPKRDLAFQIRAYKPGYVFRGKWLNQALLVPAPDEQANVAELTAAIREPYDLWHVGLSRFPRYRQFVLGEVAKQSPETRARIEAETSGDHLE